MNGDERLLPLEVFHRRDEFSTDFFEFSTKEQNRQTRKERSPKSCTKIGTKIMHQNHAPKSCTKIMEMIKG
ncbi:MULTISPECIES: hypothetical protein [Planktothricoides]|uniref:Uncharacterized protein n=1 Tax=Planktothricoides raciborskii FACHB-1370 TaxID=2949576 RepID=A0ABR8EAQ3_9CYAN|nr:MULTISPECIES: hypothetical protein [Planktothricoides]MBD2543939.1 hypothetical protein [Planktothricoides raciborskii FACHB-1370]MBD2582926.1 hypothetical protein [Planktothricoides raciborskii FACHB-1261]